VPADTAELVAQIAASPDDDAPYAVLADALQQRGDPRGELIAVQLALAGATGERACELRRRDGELVEAHPEWVATMADHAEHLVVRWQRGFVAALRVVADDDGAGESAWHAAMATPLVSDTLAEVRVSEHDGRAPPQSIIDAIAARPPRALRRLGIDDLGWQAMHRTGPLALGALAALPLDELTVAGSAITLDWRAAPRLRALELRSPPFQLAQLAAVERWPELRALALWIADTRELARVLTPARFPALRSLALVGTEDTDAVARQLAAAPIASQLARIDLRGGTLTESGAALQLLARASELDVRWNALTKASGRGLRAIGPQQRRGRPFTARLSWRDIEDSANKRALRAARQLTNADLDDAARRAIFARAAGADPADPPAMMGASREAVAPQLPPQLAAPELAAIAELYERALSPRFAAARCQAVAATYDRAGSPFDAEIWQWRALRLARWANNPAAEREVRSSLGALRLQRGDHATATVQVDRAAALATTKRERAWAARQRATAAASRSEFAAAEPLYREALALFRDDGDRRGEAVVLADLAIVHWWRQDLAGAEAVLREALAIPELGDQGAAHAWMSLASILNGQRRLDDARAAAERSREMSAAAGRRGNEAQALSLLSELARRQRRYADARELVAAAIAILRERGERRNEGVALGNLARVAIEDESYDEAREACEAALELDRECSNTYSEALQLMYLADIALARGDAAEARAWCEQSTARFEAIASHVGIAAAEMRHGIADQLAGDAAAADARYTLARAAARRAGDLEMVVWVELWTAINAAARGSATAANVVLARAASVLAGHLPSDACRASIEMATAVVARCAGGDVELPAAVDWDTRVLRRFAP
jgi:uncharacterized protein (TIGR02996 family)